MKNNNESKVKRLIKKLEKEGYKLEDVTDKSIKQLTNSKSLQNFEKLVKRKLERKKIIEENKKYDEKVAKKIESENEKVFKLFPWVKKVMKFDEKYKNLKRAKDVYNRKIKEEQNEIESTLNKYFNKKDKGLKALLRDVKKEGNIEVLKRFNDVLEYILQAYGEEEKDANSFEFKLDNDEVIERIHSRFRIEILNK